MEEMEVVGSMPRLARKRRRLNAVLDKIASHIKPVNPGPINSINGEDMEIKEDADEDLLSPSKMYEDQDTDLDGRKNSTAALRREQWRETQHQSIGSIDDGRLDGRYIRTDGGRPPDPVFKFDSLDKERLGMAGAISEEACEEEDVFSPISSRSPHSSLSSPQVSVDSPRICFSPLRIKDSIEEEEDNRGIVRATSLTVPDNVIFPLPTLSVRGCDSFNSNDGRRSPGKRCLPPGPHMVRWPSPGPEPNKHSLHPTSGLSPHTRSTSPLSPATPSTPISPSPSNYFHQFEQYFKSKYMGDMYNRRCMSETDLSATWEHLRQDRGVPITDIEDPDPIISLEPKFDPSSFTLKTHPKASSLESDQSSISLQESPLDLSVRSSVSSTTGLSHEQLAALQSTSDTIASRFLFSGIKKNPMAMSSFSLRSLPTDSMVGPNTSVSVSKESIATKYNLEMSPVVEAMPPGSELTYVCPICGQMFSLHDRLAKHMASRHKSRSTDSSSKQYLCDICKRSFARSDMLTRHMRLHTGIKPYTCRMCGQVFSRSDHLSTHQRTHTGEKPYRCPSCPYSACRRDMITRHMRTHSRYELQDSSSMDDSESRADPSRSMSGDSGNLSREMSGEVSFDMKQESSG